MCFVKCVCVVCALLLLLFFSFLLSFPYYFFILFWLGEKGEGCVSVLLLLYCCVVLVGLLEARKWKPRRSYRVVAALCGIMKPSHGGSQVIVMRT